LWGTLITTIFIGAVKDLQRGDIVKPVLMILIILLLKGLKPMKVVSFVSVLGIILFLISPFFDLLRAKSFYDKEVSIEVIADVTTNERALEYVDVEKGNLFSFDSFLRQLARKNVLPKTAATLARKAEREGFILFTTFPTILFEFVPRMVMKNKPVALSVNKTKETTAASIAGRELGIESSIWETGGGTLYWQFWWVGVILGGVLVGLCWGLTLKYAFYGSSFIFLVLVLNTFNWGQFLILGLDNFILDIVRNFKIMLMFIIPNLAVMSIFLKNKDKLETEN